MARVLATVALTCAAFVLALAPLAGQPPKGKRYALLVGVSYYKNVYYSPLKGTENDVVELAKVLQQPESGFEVTLLTSTPGHKNPALAPTAANIRKAMAKLLEGKGREDTVLLAFAGHGADVEVADPDGKQPAKTYTYFFPTDADDLEKVSHSTGHSDHLIEMGDVLKRMTAPKCGAGTKLLLVDACRENVKAASSVRARSRGLTPATTVPEGISALFSCGPGELALETGFDVGEEEKRIHGVFFWHVIEGLKGKAANRRGTISWPSLTDYVQEEVPAFVKDVVKRKQPQRPHAISNSPGLAVLVSAVEGPKEKPGTEKVARAGKEVVSSIGMKLVPIPKGRFRMGSTEDERKEVLKLIDQKEMPDWLKGEVQHEVELTRDFHLGEKEVTQEEYEKVLGKNPSYFSATGGGKDKVKGMDTGKFPVENVSWDEAVKFCEELTKRDRTAGTIGRGQEYRLPTEAEWEYSCRGGVRSYQTFHFGNSISTDQANIARNYPYSAAGKDLGRTTKTGSYEKNGFGLYDMHGDVWEWCADWYDASYYQSSPHRDPSGPSKGSGRVLRGGGWGLSGVFCRSALRYWLAPVARDQGYGFRVALVPSGE